MLSDLIGWTGLAMALAFASVLARKCPSIAVPLLLGAILRLSAALFHYYIAPLPDGTADAQHFEQVAWTLASSSGSILQNFHYSASFIYSAVMACLYEVTVRSPLMLQSVSVLAGISCIYLVYCLTLLLWENTRAANYAAWLAALFPTAVLYSALTMREMFFDAFLLVGLAFAVLWSRSGKPKYVGGAMLFLIIGFGFHSGMLAAVAAVAIALVAKALAHTASSLARGQVQVLKLVLLFGLGSIALLVLMIDPRIPKFGQFSGLFSPAPYVNLLADRVTGSAAFPNWTVPSSGPDLYWAIPLRVAYFLWSPFPWDVSNPAHLVGAVDASLYIVLTCLSFGSLPDLCRRRGRALVLLVLIGLTVAFAVGTGNFGTALRHRTKILFLFIVLAAPVLASMRLSARAGAPRRDAQC